MPIDPGVLREARARAGMSQQDIAARLGVTQPTVSNWEQGRTQPRASQVEQLGAFLDLEPEPLGGDEDEVPSSSPFGEWLARTRARSGLTRKELAESAGVSEPQIFNIEKGKHTTPVPTLEPDWPMPSGRCLPRRPLRSRKPTRRFPRWGF